MPLCILLARQKRAGFSYAHCLVTTATIASLLLCRMPSDAVAQNAGGAVQAPPQAQAPQEAVKENKPAAAEKNSIIKLTAQRTGKNLEITILCSKSPNHTAYELPGSGKKGIVVDIADAEMQKSADITSLKAFKVTLNDTSKTDAELHRLRLEFNLPEPYSSYTASLKENSVVLLLENFFKDESAAPAPVDAAPLSIPAPTVPPGKEEAKKSTAGTPSGESIDAHLPIVNPMKGSGNVGSASNQVAGAATAPPSLGGSGGAPITVDFYKVDLHNVFRLLGEVSGYNIIVAEGVSGTLTLALHEVPWDFVLDVILNLKDLAKEQRFNTIVIYPKSKEFVWPKRAAAEISLSIEPEGGKSGPKSSIIIGPGADGPGQQPSEVMEAQKIVAVGSKAEKEGSLETAVQLYEKALDIWPDKVEKKEKSKLANKIASLYLSRLNQNAKAVYYARKSLAADKKNSSAALNAAIGHANMEENSQAQQYFDQSISSGAPSREALFNYAVFSERQKQYDAALKLLNKYSELYGDDLDSMVSRARILDQQGRKEEADRAYAAVLHAGFSVPQDLRAYIMSRIRFN